MVWSTRKTATTRYAKIGDATGGELFCEGGTMPMRVIVRSLADVSKRLWHRQATNQSLFMPEHMLITHSMFISLPPEHVAEGSDALQSRQFTVEVPET